MANIHFLQFVKYKDLLCFIIFYHGKLNYLHCWLDYFQLGHEEILKGLFSLSTTF